MGARGPEGAPTEALYVRTQLTGVKDPRLLALRETFDSLPRDDQERIDSWATRARALRSMGILGAFELAMTIYNLSKAHGFTFADMERYCERVRRIT
jgi:hypothetical protein